MPTKKDKFFSNQQLVPFHLAIPVHDVKLCSEFYRRVLGCELGRECPNGVWADLNFFGHQVVLHKSPLAPILLQNLHAKSRNSVDSDAVPVPHFGLCLEKKSQFDAIAKRAKKNVPKQDWVLQPRLRFRGTPGAQFTMFWLDPSKNAIEFKCMKLGNAKTLFAKFK